MICHGEFVARQPAPDRLPKFYLAIAAGATSPLHAAPGVVGRIAHDAGVKRLIVSHIGLFDLDAAIAELKKSYSGPLTIGADLQCTPAQ